MKLNEQRPFGATRIIPAVRLAEGVPRLPPLTVQLEDLALRIPVLCWSTRTVVVRENVWRLEVEFEGVIDGDDAILFWNEISQYPSENLDTFLLWCDKDLEKHDLKSS